MTRYFLGADIGGTKTHVLIADQNGQAVGFGATGPGSHEIVGYGGLRGALRTATTKALVSATLTIADIAGAGFGVAGYDWPSERAQTLSAIETLGLQARLDAVNDTIIGLLAGSAEGWGVSVVAGTGCNCWGWDRSRQHVGRVTGAGGEMGEGAGASELVGRAVQAVAQAWTRRGPTTALTAALLDYTHLRNTAELLESIVERRVVLTSDAAPLVFQVAAHGDPVAIDAIQWAGRELGELANAVIRQLEFEALEFDVVLVGSMYDGGPLLIDPMRAAVQALAPGARLVRLGAPPVAGAVLLGMETAGITPTPATRQTLVRTLAAMRGDPVRER